MFLHSLRKQYPIWLLLALLLPTLAYAQSPSNPPRILESSTENHFPDNLVFHITAESDAPIKRITLFYSVRGDIGVTRQNLDFERGTHVEAQYTWDTSRSGAAPSTPVLYTWEVVDTNGNVTRSEEMLVYYHDVRFQWHEIQDEDLVVRWYDGDAAFGETLHTTARAALNRMAQESGGSLEYPVYLVVYPDQETFASWHSYVNEWVGGEAYTSMGLTVEIISPNDPYDWIQTVIWHEIAHLFFYQAAHAANTDWPHWMDEGIAQYYEPGDHTTALGRASAAAKEGRLIPLDTLSGSFSSDSDKALLAYAEALSAVTYMRTHWGEAEFQALIAAIKAHQPFHDAFQQAYGIRWEEFIAQWMTWMGVPATPAPPPTATPTLAFPTAPSWYTPTPLAATVTPSPSAVPTHTPLASPTPVSPQQDAAAPLPSPLLRAAILLLIGLFASLALRRKKQ
ncbi:MAG: hypothetical protein D6755_08190 [Anaerolineae bacterium]|nr:MAG: hypothetical protein D6755_08190 [Anaerolineae bacterium]